MTSRRAAAALAVWTLAACSRPPARQAAARACVLLRLADWQAALAELERAIAAEPGEPYWRLYRATALSRLGRPVDGPAPVPKPPLVSHQAEPGRPVASVQARVPLAAADEWPLGSRCSSEVLPASPG